ncbi:hypothetical protein Fot_11531 [Forsythia ovata]|uniref:Uncharacterized protein n=1 Tax=Forsythia ovata TaxID=205694 RepID=A0ABD1WJZ0_9LAMI
MVCLSTGYGQQSIALDAKVFAVDGAMSSRFVSAECSFLHTSGKSSGLRLYTLGTMSEGLVNGNGSGSNHTLGWRWAGHLCLLLDFVPFMCLKPLVAGILHEVEFEHVEILAGMNKVDTLNYL